MLDDALHQVHQGITTLEEVARAVPVDPWRGEKAVRPRAAPAPWLPEWAVEAAAVLASASGGGASGERGDDAATEGAAGSDHPRADVAGAATILVVDDQPEILRLVGHTLDDPCRIRAASDGVEANQAVGEERPDLIVLDVMMPRLSGYDVCLRVKEDPSTRHIPALLLSARGDRAQVTKGFYAGAEDCLPAPFDPEELQPRVRALLRRVGWRS